MSPSCDPGDGISIRRAGEVAGRFPALSQLILQGADAVIASAHCVGVTSYPSVGTDPEA
jgi:hypothetical protein